MSDPLTVAMLGYRFMGRAHANALSHLPMFFPDAPAVERTVLLGRDETAVASAADRLGFPRTSTDWRAVVEDVDILYNLGPNHLHAEPSIAALEADAHVFCEKPLAHTLNAAGRMYEVSEDADAVTGIGFNYRFVPAIQYAKALIEDGVLGDIVHVRAHYLQDWLVDPTAPWSWRNDAALAGSGALGDLGSHLLDLARFLVGDAAGPIKAVSGHLETFVDERPTSNDGEIRPVTVDDAFTAQSRFANGATGIFEASRSAPGAKNDLSIAIDGSQGSIRFELERLNELEILRGDNRGFQTVLVTDEDDPYIDHWWPPGHILAWEHTFVHENYEFLRAIDAGGSADPTFADGYRVQVLLDAIQRSDATGEWIAID